MTRNPILKVLFTFKRFRVKSLLIGGQASIIYGASEFSRDTDFVVLCDAGNLERIKKSLRYLKAENIYVPPLEKKYLDKGHACHFRSHCKSSRGMRIDILAKLRGCDDFEKLWKRRYMVKLPANKSIDVISLEDLVSSKKTQRNKDWFMLNNLIQNDIVLTRKPVIGKIKWWFMECRNPETLIDLAGRYRKIAERTKEARPLLKYALQGKSRDLQDALKKEELAEREKDRKYWQPLRKELEVLRRMKSI